jgi:hypothetical protein
MFGIGPFELAIIVAIAILGIAVAGLVVAAAVKILFPRHHD